MPRGHQRRAAKGWPDVADLEDFGPIPPRAPRQLEWNAQLRRAGAQLAQLRRGLRVDWPARTAIEVGDHLDIVARREGSRELDRVPLVASLPAAKAVRVERDTDGR